MATTEDGNHLGVRSEVGAAGEVLKAQAVFVGAIVLKQPLREERNSHAGNRSAVATVRRSGADQRAYTFLEKKDDVGASEEKVAGLVAFLEVVADFAGHLDRGDLAHSDGDNADESDVAFRRVGGVDALQTGSIDPQSQTGIVLSGRFRTRRGTEPRKSSRSKLKS